MYTIFVKTNNRSWNVNLSGPFKTKEEALETVKKLHNRLNTLNIGAPRYKFAVQYIDTASLDENVVAID
jgi:hypothetical protein